MSKSKKKVKNKWLKQSICCESNTGEVVTQPNQSITIRQLLFNNTAGMTYDNYKTPYYETQATFSSQSLNKIQEMEPVEKLQYLNVVKGQVEDLSKQIKDFEDAKIKAVKESQQSQTTTNEADSNTDS